MEGGLAILLLTALPILFLVAVWAVGTAIRLTLPERSLPIELSPVVRRRHMTMQGRAVPVGLREIREDFRLQQFDAPPTHYCYDGFERHCIPDDWAADLELRRN